MSELVPNKRQTFLQYLQRGVTMVHLDARRSGVVVPPQYAGDAHLRLNLSHRYSIPDFEIDDRCVQATLSFKGAPFHCILPWEAIFGITSHAGAGQVWPEDLPTEVMQTLATRQERPAADRPPDEGFSAARPAAAAPVPARRTRARLTAVPEEAREGDAASTATTDGTSSQDDGGPRRPHLRLVR